MIHLQDVHKSYPTHFGAKEVLRGVNISFAPGEKVGILGRNGAGKTTLLRLIAGVEYPNSGRIERRMSVSWPLGFAGAMHYSISGADNARFIARIYDKPIQEIVEFVEDFADLGNYFLGWQSWLAGFPLEFGEVCLGIAPKAGAQGSRLAPRVQPVPEVGP
jgi:capsular polysaccharide transport system ATP-binding protein